MTEYKQRRGETFYFRRTVPHDIRHLIFTKNGKPATEWVWSLEVKELAKAKPLLRKAADQTDLWITEARQQLAAQADGTKATPRSHREAEEQAARAATEAVSQEMYEARSDLRVHLRQRIGISTKELTPQEAAWRDLLREKDADLAALREAGAGQQGANVTLANKMGKQIGDPISIMMLFDDWAKQRGKPDTVAQYRSYAESFALYVNNVDARTVTKANVIAWRKHLRENGGRSGKQLSISTINTAYMTAICAVFRFAVDETGRIEVDPTEGVKALQEKKKALLRPKSITDAEAVAILAESMRPGSKRLCPRRAASLRWCPWLMAYTGARVLEIAQLRKQDVSVQDDIPYLRITPEAGKQKTETVRDVPIHPHLIQQGFLAFVAAQPDGPIFYDPEKGKGGRLASHPKQIGQSLCERVRALGIDVPQPNHGWRHRMETMNQRYDLRDKTVRAILGHSAPDANGNYGDAELSVMLREISKIPAYQGPGLPQYVNKGLAVPVASTAGSE